MSNRMLVGDLNRKYNNYKSEVLFFERKGSAFTFLSTYLTSFFSFSSLVEMYNPDEKGARRWSMTDIATFDAAACHSRIIWSPHHVVEPMTRNEWPNFVEFEYYPADAIPVGESLNLGVLDNYLFSLGQSMITNYVEDKKSELNQKYGKVGNWPAVWNFARVVRNAMSHGGKIRIDDNTEVSWRGISYNKSDNGRNIINTDLWPGDLFFLMKEMEIDVG